MPSLVASSLSVGLFSTIATWIRLAPAILSNGAGSMA